MARHELGPAALAVAQAAAACLPVDGDVVVGCSGGADSLALALGAAWAARRTTCRVKCIVVDHGLQEGSAEVAAATVVKLAARGIDAAMVGVEIDSAAPGGPEAAAREARLAALSARGVPVLLGHTLDDQAESVLLGLLRGSGTRAIAGMAPVRGPFLRPLLGLRRATTRRACREWDLEWWEDPHNEDPRFARVRARRYLSGLIGSLGRDVAPALARTAELARIDADFLDQLARDAVQGIDLTEPLDAVLLLGVPTALRLRVLRDWLGVQGVQEATMTHLMAVDALVTAWRGQGAVALPGGRVARSTGLLVFERADRRATRR